MSWKNLGRNDREEKDIASLDKLTSNCDFFPLSIVWKRLRKRKRFQALSYTGNGKLTIDITCVSIETSFNDNRQSYILYFNYHERIHLRVSKHVHLTLKTDSRTRWVITTRTCGSKDPRNNSLRNEVSTIICIYFAFTSLRAHFVEVVANLERNYYY